MMEFYKMQGCGNDFCVIEEFKDADYAMLAVKLCNRSLGVGADGLIVVKKNPLAMHILNPDGSEAYVSGNGLRCFARYCYEKKLVKDLKFSAITYNGIVVFNITSTNPFLVKVEMGQPKFGNQHLYINDQIDSFGRLLTVKEYRLTSYSLAIGSVHTILFVDNINSELLKIAGQISKHNLFRRKTNVDFVHVIDEKNIELRTYVMDMGFVNSCGSGACAAVIACSKLGLTNKLVSVHLEYEKLNVEINRKGNVFLEGPAVISYIGKVKECLTC